MKKKWRAHIYMKNGAVIDFICDRYEDLFTVNWIVFKLGLETVAKVIRSEIIAIVYEALQEEEEDGKPVED